MNTTLERWRPLCVLTAASLLACVSLAGAGDLVVDGNLVVSNNLAIGTNATSARLHVNGNAAIDGVLNISDTNYNTIIQHPADPVSKVICSVAVGASALKQATGFNNTALGVAARANAAGNDSVGIGFWAGGFSTGDYNVAVGDMAQYSRNGTWNTAVGYWSLGAFGNPPVVTGSWNTAVGGLIGLGCGDCNSALGFMAMRWADNSSYNVAVGNGALFMADNDMANTALGSGAGKEATNTHYSIFLGANTGFRVSNVTNVTLIGHTLTASRPNVMVLGNNQDVGIGTNDPAARLDVNGSVIVRGPLDLAANRLINLASPVEDGDAVTKAYLAAALQNVPPMGDVGMGCYTNRP